MANDLEDLYKVTPKTEEPVKMVPRIERSQYRFYLPGDPTGDFGQTWKWLLKEWGVPTNSKAPERDLSLRISAHLDKMEKSARILEEIQELKARHDALSKLGTSSEFQPLPNPITEYLAELQLLKVHVEQVVRGEGRRSFWSSVWVNALFFVGGIVMTLLLK